MDTPKKPARKKSAEGAKDEPAPAPVIQTDVVPKATPARVKIPKLAKKDKHRLPRKLKKQLQKEAARKAS
jgi:hypothetical protein